MLNTLLRTLRERAGLSPQEAAEAIGTKSSTLYSWETDARWRRTPGVEALTRLLEVYGASKDEQERAFLMRGNGGSMPTLSPPSASAA